MGFIIISEKEIYNGFYYYPKQIMDFNKERQNMIVQGVKLVESDDFTETYDKLDDDFEEFDGLEDDFEDEFFLDDLEDDLEEDLIDEIYAVDGFDLREDRL